MDGLVLVLIFLAIAIVGAALYGGSVRAWLRAEWRAGNEDTFYRSDYLVNPRLGSVTDDRVARMVIRQRALGKRMRRDGRTLHADKPYVPVLTKAVPPPVPPKAFRVVVPMRHRK